MKKTCLYPFLFILVALACASCVTVTEPSTSKPAPLPVNTVLPASVSLTEVPASATPFSVTATSAPASVEGTSVSYGPLHLVLPQGLASGISGVQFPRADGDNVAPWDVTPGHTVLKLEGYPLQGKTHEPQIYVYPAQAYAEMYPAAFESIRRLDNILYGPNGVSLSADKLPTVPFFNAQQAFSADAEPISFQNGSGVRTLTEYAQYPVSANNQDLFYHFEGLSRDGAYYIIAILPITAPALAATSDSGAAIPPGGVAYPDLSDAKTDMPGYYAAVAGLLNDTPGTAFAPTIRQLDALIQSIRVAQ